MHIRAGACEARLYARGGGVQLGEQGRAVAAFRCREAGVHYRTSHLFALIALIVDVVVQGYRSDDQHVISFFMSPLPNLVNDLMISQFFHGDNALCDSHNPQKFLHLAVLV